MDTMCFHSLENIYFEPLLRLGFTYQMVELCHNVCFSLWDISLLWKLCYHLILEYFFKLQHVISSCSLPHATWCHYVMFLGRTSNHDNRTISLHCNLFHYEPWVKISFYYCHGKWVMVVPCMYLLNRFSKCHCFALLLWLLQLKRQWCLECILKLEGFAKTKSFLLRRDLQYNNLMSNSEIQVPRVIVDMSSFWLTLVLASSHWRKKPKWRNPFVLIVP